MASITVPPHSQQITYTHLVVRKYPTWRRAVVAATSEWDAGTRERMRTQASALNKVLTPTLPLRFPLQKTYFRHAGSPVTQVSPTPYCLYYTARTITRCRIQNLFHFWPYHTARTGTALLSLVLHVPCPYSLDQTLLSEKTHVLALYPRVLLASQKTIPALERKTAREAHTCIAVSYTHLTLPTTPYV